MRKTILCSTSLMNCEEVLPTLRKTGQYKVETEMNEQKLKLLEWLQPP